MAQFHQMKAAFFLSLTLLLISFSTHAAAEVRVNGRVFYAKLDPEKPSFLFHSVISEKDGKSTVVSTYSDINDKALIVEETEFSGEHLVHYSYKQQQVNESGEATFENGKVQMSFTEAGKTEKDTEDHDATLIVAPMIGPLLRKKWDDIMKGETIRVRYLAIERLETIGFKFYKEEERTLKGKAVVDVIMKPSSFFIAALVAPVRITVSKEAPHYIVESEGRTPIRVPQHIPPQRRKDWKAIDARVEYDPPLTVSR